MAIDLSDAAPCKINEAVYIIPSKENKYFKELVSNIPGGPMNVSDLEQSTTIDHDLYCVWGELYWMIGATQDLLAPIDQDPLVFALQDFQNSSQIKVTVTGRATASFLNPDLAEICVIGAKTIPLGPAENRFETQSVNIPFSLFVDDSVKGCIVLISKWLYSFHATTLGGVDSLQFVLTTTIKERIEEVEEVVVKNEPISPSTITEDDPTEECDGSSVTISDCHSSHSGTSSSGEISEDSDDCLYTKLNDIDDGDGHTMVDIAGVIEQSKQPSHSIGNDYFVSFHITDPSIHEMSVNVIAFNGKRDKLPSVNKVGNIILLRHVRIEFYNFAPLIIAPFFSTFHVFRPKSFIPFCSSSPERSLSREDIDTVRLLNRWYYGYDDNDPTTVKCKDLRTFKIVVPNMKFNIVGKLCGMEELVDKSILCIALADGTVPMFKYGDINYILKETKHPCLSMPIMVYNSSVISSLVKMSLGDYIYIENIQAPLPCAQTKNGLCMRHNKFRINNDDSAAVFKIPELDPESRRVQNNLNFPIGRPHSSSFPSLTKVVTFNVFDDLPFSRIRDIVMSEEIPAKFRLDVKPLKMAASRVEDIVKLYCKACLTEYEIPKTLDEKESEQFIKPGAHCCSDKCQNNPENAVSYMYSFKFTIADSSGELQVSVLGDEALLLIPNTTPCNLYLNKQMQDKVLRALVGLFGRDPFAIKKPKRVRVTRMDCGVFTFYPNGVPASEKKHNATVFYRLFGTVLLSKVIK